MDDGLTIPGPEARTVRQVLGEALVRLARDLVGLQPAFALSEPRRRELDRVRRIVLERWKREPGAVLSLLRWPTIGAPLRVMRDGGGDERLLGQWLATIGIEMAAAGLLDGDFVVTAPPARVVRASRCDGVEPGAGVDELAIRLDGSVLADGRLVQPIPMAVAVDESLQLALVDDNPLAMVEAHPDKSGNALDLGGRDVDGWLDALRHARRLLRDHAPGLARAAELLLRRVVPVGWDDRQHLSASYREAIGLAYLSLHPSPLTMLEALVHEAQHNVLNALFEVDDVLLDGWEPRHRSPVRPDLRPLGGVLLAVHAFVAVAHVLQRMREADHPLARGPHFERRLREVVRLNREGIATLRAHAHPTARGAALLAELEAWDARCGADDA
ncbi:MAG: HEXXH motif-containing putative peptide modification protein [Myxococcales bacterium]|nr:HEXXH motif-containing putative peptide modification protein [Myxococcales bacterium]